LDNKVFYIIDARSNHEIYLLSRLSLLPYLVIPATGFRNRPMWPDRPRRVWGHY